MSIFTKNCPVCGASQPREAERCSCGHRFDTDASGGEAQELESIYHEERLYRDYLAARVDEAAKGADKGALATARAELEAQEQRVRAVKQRLKLIRSNSRLQKSTTPAKAVAPTVSKAIAPAVAPAKPPARIGPTVSSLPVKPKSSAATAQPPSASKPVAHPSNVQRTAVRPPGKPAASMRPARAAARPAPPPKPPDAPSRPTPSAPARAAPRGPGKSVPSSPVGNGSKAATQECPNCMAKVPVGAARCACGYEMASHANEMPGLPMSPEDRAAFLAALRPSRKE
jgi:hypothetical protein